MTEEEHILSRQYNYAKAGKHNVIKYANMLTDDDKMQLINTLVTFENSHIIANGFKDDKVAWALKEELEVVLHKDNK